MKTPKLLALVSICFILSCTNMQQKKEDLVYLQSASFAEMGLPFCEVVRYGNTLYLSGQVGNIPGTANLVEGGIVPETRQTMLNIKQKQIDKKACIQTAQITTSINFLC